MTHKLNSHSLPELNEKQQEDVLWDKAESITQILSALPTPNAPNDHADLCSSSVDYTNFDNLVAVHHQHQTI